MHIVVTHLTRMYHGHICVAGVEKDTREHVRPVLRGDGIPKELHSRNGGPLEVGAVIDFGPVRRCGAAPEIEDCYFEIRNVRRVGAVGEEQLWNLLDALAAAELPAIFGDCLMTPPGCPRSLATPEGQGNASLGVWRPQCRPRLELESAGQKAKVRLVIDDAGKSLPVTDVRLFQSDMLTCDEAAFHRCREALEGATDVLLCVGLGRPWSPTGSRLPRYHWLQVNGIHLRTPAGRLSPKPEPLVNTAELFMALRKWRAAEAARRKLPAYCIISTEALKGIASQMPQTLGALERIKGVGPRTVAKYGEDILRVVHPSDSA